MSSCHIFVDQPEIGGTPVILGLLLSAFGGGLDASQALVMGLAKRWRWESIWLVWALFGCVILPWSAAFLLSLSRAGWP